jgi:hypothetical protein
MINVKTILLATALSSSILGSLPKAAQSGGVGPSKLTGPDLISHSTARFSATKRDTVYTYWVVLNHLSTTDTAVDVTIL